MDFVESGARNTKTWQFAFGFYRNRQFANFAYVKLGKNACPKNVVDLFYNWNSCKPNGGK